MISAIIPECYVDTCLINILLNIGAKESVNHAKGNSSVAVKMKTFFGNSFAVGIIDRDKRPVEYIKEFDLYNNTIAEKSILYKHPDRHHYFIQLCPESETWICSVAYELGINMEEEFGLPNNPRDLSKVSKEVGVGSDVRFVGLFKKIRKVAYETNYEPVVKLIYWLNELRNNTYQVNIDNLTN